jgi:hypothetical protein
LGNALAHSSGLSAAQSVLRGSDALIENSLGASAAAKWDASFNSNHLKRNGICVSTVSTISDRDRHLPDRAPVHSCQCSGAVIAKGTGRPRRRLC